MMPVAHVKRGCRPSALMEGCVTHMAFSRTHRLFAFLKLPRHVRNRNFSWCERLLKQKKRSKYPLLLWLSPPTDMELSETKRQSFRLHRGSTS